MEYWGWDYIFGRWKEQWPPSLYVGNLERNVRDADLYDLFSQSAHVVSVHICRDHFTNISFGYGYVFFTNRQDAERALKELNFISFNGKSIRVMYYGGHNPSLIGVGNIFIKNLDKSIDHVALYNTFSCYGFIVRSKVATDAFGQSKGFGFVQYDTEDSAHEAVESMNGILLTGKQVYVGPFRQRDSEGEKAIFVNVVVKKLPKYMTEEKLNTVFEKFGPTTSCVIKIDDQGNSRRFGYVNFVNPDDAAKAVEALNGKRIGYYKEWFVTKSRKKYEMASAIKQRLKNSVERSQGSENLCVKNLPKSVTDQNLSAFFSSYGDITSCKVMRDTNGESKGSGFVAFSKHEELSKAMEDINGEQVYVDVLAISLANATPKEQRIKLGENLYPMVEQLEPESAAKITGVLLEMDQTEVLHLLESFVALESKVAEAMEILRTVEYQKHKKQYGCLTESLAKHTLSLTESDSDSKTSIIPKTQLNSSALANKYSGLGGSESANDSKSSLSPRFKSPKPSSVARVSKRLEAREVSVGLMTNRFDSLKGVGE